MANCYVDYSFKKKLGGERMLVGIDEVIDSENYNGFIRSH